MKINKSNIVTMRPVLARALKQTKGDIAFDFEMSGIALPTPLHITEKLPSLRSKLLVDHYLAESVGAAARYAPLQMGLCLTRLDGVREWTTDEKREDGSAYSRQWQHFTYSLYPVDVDLFPRTILPSSMHIRRQREVVISGDGGEFLRRNGFSFDNIIDKGANYCRPDEMEEAISHWKNKLNDDPPPPPSEEDQGTLAPLLQQFEGDEGGIAFADRVERGESVDESTFTLCEWKKLDWKSIALLKQHFLSKYRKIEFRFEWKDGVKYACLRALEEERKGDLSKKLDYLNDNLAFNSIISDVVQALSGSQSGEGEEGTNRALLGHLCMMDLLFFIQHFQKDLSPLAAAGPSQACTDAVAAAVAQVASVIRDCKISAKSLLEEGEKSHLGGVYQAFLMRFASGTSVPPSPPEKDEEEKSGESGAKEGEKVEESKDAKESVAKADGAQGGDKMEVEDQEEGDDKKEEVVAPREYEVTYHVPSEEGEDEKSVKITLKEGVWEEYAETDEEKEAAKKLQPQIASHFPTTSDELATSSAHNAGFDAFMTAVEGLLTKHFAPSSCRNDFFTVFGSPIKLALDRSNGSANAKWSVESKCSLSVDSMFIIDGLSSSVDEKDLKAVAGDDVYVQWLSDDSCLVLGASPLSDANVAEIRSKAEKKEWRVTRATKADFGIEEENAGETEPKAKRARVE